NVDVPEQLATLVPSLVELSGRVPVVFPLHPRTRSRLEQLGHLTTLADGGVVCTEPLGYLDFLSLELGAGAVVTDSGGVQEETTCLGVPCYTLRPNTERPITISQGTNVLLGPDPAAIASVQLGGRPHPA